MAEVNRYIEYENGDFAVDLFPYKIKNRDNFIYRDHPVGLNPNSFRFKQYWEDFLKLCLEGKWVNDEGTWVFMMPKLFFYINYVVLSDEERNRINPRLRDNEWIAFTYFLCSEGFSGFEGDDKYTCNKHVGKLQRGELLQKFEQKAIDEDQFVKTENGEYKQYVDPWTYLTETYLITDKRDRPLGQPIYNNGYYNIMMLCARAIGKSYAVFMGYFFHEWLFGGIKRYEDRFKVNNDVLFTLTSPDTKALTRSVSNLQRAYYQMPGQYEFPTKKKDKSVKYYGPFYKNIRGTWQVGASASTVEHVVKKKDNTNAITGSLTQITLMKPTDFKILTGDRFRQAIIEEVGFVKNLKQIFSASKDALRVGKKWVGQLIMLGTGGDMASIQEPKDLFENPEVYNIFPIPNYWVNKGGEHKKTCGLFIGSYYKSEELKDPQGNTIIADALFDVVKERQKNKASMDSISFGNDIMWNPIYPKELLRPSHKSALPITELNEHREYIIQTDIWKKRATVGKFAYSGGEVIFKPDLDRELNPILEWGRDSDLEDKSGAWIMYEDTPDFIPAGLYYVLIDPIQQSGEGTSLQSILVYKRKFTGGDNSMQDTIVASYVGRIVDGGIMGADKNHEEAIKVARYYNATVFPEMNAIAFAMYVGTKNLEKFMEPTPFNVLRAIKGSTLKAHNVSPYKFGIKTNLAMNEWAINRVADWLMTPTHFDSNNIPIRRVYQGIFDIRLLSELINFDFENKGDFDSVSALMLLPYLLADWDDEGVEITEESEEDIYSKYDQNGITYDYVNGRAKFLDY